MKIEYTTAKHKGEPEEWRPAVQVQFHDDGRAYVFVAAPETDWHITKIPTAVRKDGVIAYDIRAEAPPELFLWRADGVRPSVVLAPESETTPGAPGRSAPIEEAAAQALALILGVKLRRW